MSYANCRKVGSGTSVTPTVRTWNNPNIINVNTIPQTMIMLEADTLQEGFFYQVQAGLFFRDLAVNEAQVVVTANSEVLSQITCFSNIGAQGVEFNQQIVLYFYYPAGKDGTVEFRWINTESNSAGQLYADNIRLIELGEIIIPA